MSAPSAGAPPRQVIVGVDGGGTKTGVSILDAATKELLAQTVAGSTNWNSVGKEPAFLTLRRAVLCALTAASSSASDVLWIWLGRPGCALICGTGSIAVGLSAHEGVLRVGGWGPLFLDGGSGYDLGQQALAAVARATDGRGGDTILQAAICAYCNVTNSMDLLGWAYAQQGWAPIAALAPLVIAAAEGGDEVAAEIIARAADQAAGAVAAMVTKCGLQGAFPIALTGGLLEDPNSGFSKALYMRLKRDHPEAALVASSLPAHHMAALLASL
ncbi:hypothetical protein WJX81_002676 [Elliptochloris bilobata]|uniref:N-acetyl-D-glucosamine kinase n=1 Tax=Elliptochloris bilobata TaxID=381761 RepID=A0AAW1SE69_9CHLO